MTDTSEQLLPCPFCNQNAQFDMMAHEQTHGRDEYSPECTECGATILGDKLTTKALAAAAWNTRAPRQLDAEVVARVQADMKLAEDRNHLYCTLRLSDVKAMLAALSVPIATQSLS